MADSGNTRVLNLRKEFEEHCRKCLLNPQKDKLEWYTCEEEVNSCTIDFIIKCPNKKHRSSGPFRWEPNL